MLPPREDLLELPLGSIKRGERALGTGAPIE